MRIVNLCASLPRGALWHVRQSLSWINEADLMGIGFIQLLDEMPEPTLESPVWHKHAKAEGLSIYGIYVRKEANNPAHIKLFIRDIYRGLPFLYRWTPVPTLCISRTVAHEVGHHLIAQRGYIYQPDEKYGRPEYEEEMVDRYSFGILKKMKGRWLYRFAQWATNKLASHHYIQGIHSWKEKKYKEAAERWYIACQLNPARQDAAYWYWRAKRMCAE